LRYRKLSPTGDYTFGQGSANFWIDSPEGVAQSVQTRLKLWEDEWFLDKTVGMPYAQEILGYGTKALYDLAIQQEVLDTVGVASIADYSSSFNSQTRALVVNMSIFTIYSTTPVVVPQITM